MSIWKQLYQAWEEKNCEKFNNLWKQLTQEDKSSPYFSYYASLKAKLCPKSGKKGKILLKGKTIKCPSCGSPLTLSEYNKEQIRKLKNGEKQVKFVCNYCGEEFIYSKTPFKTIFSNYSIGDEITLNGKKYKLAGAVKYKGKYNEIGDSTGSLEYIEWLAYDSKGEIFYISESRARWFQEVYDELEISKKVNFPFVIKDINNSYIKTDKGEKAIEEIDEVEVVSLIGELNKGYIVGEKVKLWKFREYNLEEEKNGEHLERNLYKNESNIFKNNKITKNNGDTYTLIEIIFMLISIVVCPVLAIPIIFLVIVLYELPIYKKLPIYIVSILFLILLCNGISGIGIGGSSYSSWGGTSLGGGK